MACMSPTVAQSRWPAMIQKAQAVGDPLGASGTRILGTLARTLTESL